MQILVLVLNKAALFWSCLSLFVLLNVLDGHSTYLVMRPNHYRRERNPIARFVFRKIGIPQGIIIFKAVLLAILIPAMGFYAGNDLFTINIVLLVSNLVFLMVVIHNYRLYNKIKQWSKI
ncbi:MAG: DUF5658 family protein [Candidatus Cloacimonadaceae bacterium]|nr:DUF5658 family protein [Candidatus Cloacimonadota bacterium]MCK9178385.1 DUF5658 family protein [Candidatus Cloacimonadota bacterium]MDD3533280.1 DUF5658 family protein [Candidatus Cloacimonadota bacterium]MDY0128093.1 DUF5658 family protein [Candidatus Cloacimonadaceae bacterium]